MGKKQQEKKARREAEILNIIAKTLRRFYLPELRDLAVSQAEDQLVRWFKSSPFRDYIQEIVDQAVMDAIGRLVASRIKIDVSLLKLEAQHDDHQV